jgi:hypothetical protein
MLPPCLRLARSFRTLCFLFVLVFTVGANAGVIINEIMYRPGSGYPENIGLEYVELHNTDAVPVNVGGWAFRSGVSFTFPAGTTIAANGYLVVGGNPGAIQAAFSGVTVLGPWTGSLSNNGERVEMSKPGVVPGTWDLVDEVSYASEGDWAFRIREGTFGGWVWATPAESGVAMEVRNPALSNDSGLNWEPSTHLLGGTPGAPNTVLSANVSPIITDVKHSPAIPLSNEPVTISCRLLDETAAAGLTATLFWRDATDFAPGPFQSVPMTGDGSGKFSATLGAMDNRDIVEFYVSAGDGVNTRTWPAPTNEGQNANCQYQVDNGSAGDTAADSYYRLVLTAAENEEFEQLADNNPGSDRQFNMTLVFKRGADTTIRYRSQMRIRGNSSRSYMFKPLRISIANDNTLDGVRAFNLNPRNAYLQFLGMRLFQAAGVRAFDALPVELRRNSFEQTTSQGNTPNYGKWVRMEEINSDMVDEHWPGANDGNIYKKGRGGGGTDGYWRSTQPTPSNPDGLLDGWSKQNNSAANDWSDLTTFLQTWQAAAAPHFPGTPVGDVANNAGQNVTTIGNWDSTSFTSTEMESLETVADLDQWARWFAVMTIIQDNETNISNGQDDDYDVYFAPSGAQRRLNLLPHDLDTIFGLGDSPLASNARGLYDMTQSFGGFGNDSVFRPLLPLFGNATTPGEASFRNKYLNALRELYGTVFDADTTTNPYPPFYAFLDNHLAGWVPTTRINAIKTFATQRQAFLLSQIGPGTTPIFPPAATSTSTLASAHGTLMIHEVLANNVSAHANGSGFPDVIELYNSGASDIVLAGKSLSDDPALPARYVFPVGTTIPAGGYLTVYADSNTGSPGLHTGFGLDAGGDQVRLYESVANGQTLIDVIAFGPQAANLSIGRVGANRDSWTLCTPTIGAVNTAVASFGPPGGLRINEWLSNPGFRFEEDFIEVFNPAAAPVALGGMRLTDDFINAPSLHVLPPLSFVGPGGFVAFEAMGSDATPGNALELSFKVGNTFGWLALIGANGTIVDRVSIVGQPEDGSEARVPDGGPNTNTLVLPNTVGTPGITNVTPPANILALLNFLRVSELNYFPQGNTDHEFIEFTNVGPVTLDLTGVRITNGVDFVFPASNLEPGGRILVARSIPLMRNLYGNTVNVIGEYSGRLDNNGERLTVKPPQPYEAAIVNFRYESTWYPLASGGGRSLELTDVDLFPREYDESESWIPSTTPGGTPVLALVPAITSALVRNVAINEGFTYQIVAGNQPFSFNATGLPSGLAINRGTGVISGAVAANGVFNIQISATNGAGSDVETLVLTVQDVPAPNITSPNIANTIVGDFFQYQIVAANNPTSYGATGLPNGLSIDTETGLISGTPTGAGTFPVQLSATNFGGTGTLTLTLNIAVSGPMAGFVWDALGNQQVSSPFTTTLRATDAQGRTVTGFNGNVAVTCGRSSPPMVLITECGTGGNDYWEIQNVGSSPINTEGWFIVPNSANEGPIANVNGIHPAWELPPTIAPGEVIAVGENSAEYGSGVNWGSSGTILNGWCMLCDETGAVRDFVAWVYPRSELDLINFNITVGATTYNNITVPTSVWSGDGLPSVTGEIVKTRKGQADLNSGADWDVGTSETNRGVQNPNLTVPFGGAPISVPVTPNSVNVVNGVWTGTLSIGQLATAVRLTANDGANHVGESNSFDVVNPPVPSINSPTLASAVVNQPFSFQLTATATVNTWGATNLPVGMTLHPATGVISGTPTVTGGRSVALTATNASGTGNRNMTISVLADNDGDGLPDQYENNNGFNPSFAGDALLDLDGDGLTNLAEFLANTLPNNRNSRFVIISAGFDSGSFAITWNSVTNRRYRVWTATSMTGPWTALTAPLTGVSGTMSYTHSSPGGGVGRFYRVEAML